MFDPSDFRELKPKDRFNVGTQETVRLHTSQDVIVYAERHGVQAIVAKGSLNAVEVPKHSVIWYEGPKDVIGYVSDPMQDEAPKLVPARTESFTNIDKRPVVSGAMAAVTAASRLLKMEQKQILADIRKAQDDLKRTATDLKAPVLDEPANPAPAKKAETKSEPDPKTDQLEDPGQTPVEPKAE